MSEAITETVNDTTKLDAALAQANEIVEIISQIQEEKKKTYDRWLADSEKQCLDKVKLYHLLKNGGVQGLPEKLTKYYINWGFDVEVKDITDFALIKRLVGSLEHGGKEPVGDGRKKTIRVSLYPKAYPHLQYNGVKFHYLRKLTDKDKCKVVTTTCKRTEVICNV